MKFATQFLKTGEIIAYRCAGNIGPVIVLLHGNMSSSVHWNVAMRALEERAQVYALDLCGFDAPLFLFMAPGIRWYRQKSLVKWRGL